MATTRNYPPGDYPPQDLDLYPDDAVQTWRDEEQPTRVREPQRRVQESQRRTDRNRVDEWMDREFKFGGSKIKRKALALILLGLPAVVPLIFMLPATLTLNTNTFAVSVDDTLSAPVSSDHSWTYPGVACGLLIQPQFSPSVLYGEAQTEAFTQATTVKSVTQPLIATAEKEAATIIGGNFVTPTLNALDYKVSEFTIRWVASAPAT